MRIRHKPPSFLNIMRAGSVLSSTNPSRGIDRHHPRLDMRAIVRDEHIARCINHPHRMEIAARCLDLSRHRSLPGGQDLVQGSFRERLIERGVAVDLLADVLLALVGEGGVELS